MKYHLARAAAAVVALAVCCSCASMRTTELRSEPKDHPIWGLWSWVSTNGGFFNHLHSDVEGTGHTAELRFSPNGEYARYIDGIQNEAGHYTIAREKTIYGDKNVIHFIAESGKEERQVIMKLWGSDLSISDGMYDGTGSSWKLVLE